MTSPEQPWQTIDAHQMRTLPSSAMFTVVEVRDEECHFVLKATTNERRQEHLGNSVAWAQTINNDKPTTFTTPEAYAELFDDDNIIRTDVAYFDWIDGETIQEDQLDDYTVRFASIIKELSAIAVPWTGDARLWVCQRRDGKVTEAANALDDQNLAHRLLGLLSDERLTNIKPGVTHGDFSPTKNALIGSDSTINLYDAEFGTHAGRPHYAVPRMLDAAYLYHLLEVQYKQPETAEGFLEALGEQFGEDPTWHEEFWVCVVERTLSMYHNFILNPKDDPAIDPRRQQPEVYVHLLQTSVAMLRAA